MRFLLIAAALSWNLPAQSQDVTIGSKKFTESVILGEIALQLVESLGKSARHRRELGGTRVLWEALIKGNIDIYPDYTGTISQELLADRNIVGMDAMRIALHRQGIRMTEPLGFNNTYAIGVTQSTAKKYRLKKIFDLRHHPGLTLGFPTSSLTGPTDGLRCGKNTVLTWRVPEVWITTWPIAD
jgi:osmoprotectant transport system permease protein